MGQLLTPEEDEIFESLFANLTEPREPSGIAMMPQAPQPRVDVCDGPGCRNVLGDFRHLILHEDKRDQACSIACALRFSKKLGEKISSHIKVERLNGKKK